MYTPGICFGSAVVWAQRAAGLTDPVAASQASWLLTDAVKCRQVQWEYIYNKENEGLDEGSAVRHVLKDWGLQHDGQWSFGPYKSFRLRGIEEDSIGGAPYDGIFLLKLSGGGQSHWFAYRRITNTGSVKCFEFFDANHGCYRNDPEESLANCAASVTSFLDAKYVVSEVSFTDVCLFLKVKRR